MRANYCIPVQKVIKNSLDSSLFFEEFLRYDDYFPGSIRFWCGTNIHNSVIWLNWVMSDSKIITYVKFQAE